MRGLGPPRAWSPFPLLSAVPNRGKAHSTVASVQGLGFLRARFPHHVSGHFFTACSRLSATVTFPRARFPLPPAPAIRQAHPPWVSCFCSRELGPLLSFQTGYYFIARRRLSARARFSLASVDWANIARGSFSLGVFFVPEGWVPAFPFRRGDSWPVAA